MRTEGEKVSKRKLMSFFRALTIPAILKFTALPAKVANHGAQVARLASPGHSRIGNADGIIVTREEGVKGLLANTVGVVGDPIVLMGTGIEEAGPNVSDEVISG